MRLISCISHRHFSPNKIKTKALSPHTLDIFLLLFYSVFRVKIYILPDCSSQNYYMCLLFLSHMSWMNWTVTQVLWIIFLNYLLKPSFPLYFYSPSSLAPWPCIILPNSHRLATSPFSPPCHLSLSPSLLCFIYHLYIQIHFW